METPPKSTLVLRKRADGSRTIEGDAPDAHEFSARWIERELGDLVEVTVTVKTTAGDIEYTLAGFAQVESEDGPKPNFTGWRCVRKEA